MRFSWILQIDPKWHYVYPYKREAEGDLTNTKDEGAVWPQRQRLRWCGHKSRNDGRHQKLEGAGNRFSPRGSVTLKHLDFCPVTLILTSNLQKSEWINLCCFKFLIICYSCLWRLIESSFIFWLKRYFVGNILEIFCSVISKVQISEGRKKKTVRQTKTVYIL